LVPTTDLVIARLGELEPIASRRCLSAEINTKGMCHADSHLDCDPRLHDGNGRRSSVHATAQSGAEIELME
jgi:hypothetical protein